MHQLVTAKEIRVTGQRILWHEFEQTGFLTDAAHFQLTTRRGEKLYFNLEQASIVDYQGDAELIDMGWCH
jgi:hypothetical protein